MIISYLKSTFLSNILSNYFGINQRSRFLEIAGDYAYLFAILSKRRRIQIIQLQLLGVLAAISEMVNIGILIPFLGILSNPNQGIKSLGIFGTLFESLPQNLILPALGLAFILMILISSLVKSVTIRNQYRLGSLITADIGKFAFNSVLTQPYEWHLRSNSSNIICTLTNEVDSASGIIKGILSIAVNITLIVLVGLSLVIVSPLIILSAISVIALVYTIIFSVFRKGFRKDGKQRVFTYQKSIQIAQESLGGIREIILRNNQDIFIETWDGFNRERQLCDSRILTKATLPRYLIEGFLIILIGTISLGYVLFGYELTDHLPVLGAITLGAYKLMQPVQQCFTTISSLQASHAALERLRMHTQKVVSDDHSSSKSITASASFPNNNQHYIRFNKLSFKYNDNEKLILKNLNLTINRGEFIALVGPTGSGKSTVADLILGLLKPTHGHLLICDHNIHESKNSLDEWQRKISHVPQYIYLSDSNFEKNIAFGISEKDINRSRLITAAKQAKIHEFIDSTPNGYKTIVGERGIALSGGQRQRIGLARALYDDSDLLLLDEATSALDNNTEEAVMKSIKDLRGKITIMVIAHRLSTIVQCDRIILLEEGEIKGIGSYDELLSSNSSFQKLVKLNSTNRN